MDVRIYFSSLAPDTVCGRAQSEDLLYSETGRWNAGQQLEHVCLCLKAMSGALGSKDFIEQTFGRIDRPVRTYEEVQASYRSGISAGGKAPERFEPGAFEPERKAGLIAALDALLLAIQEQTAAYSEEELDMLVLPHPFLGKLTIREMFFLMTEHAGIHEASIARGLQHRNETLAAAMS
jgi:hypothetical protein